MKWCATLSHHMCIASLSCRLCMLQWKGAGADLNGATGSKMDRAHAIKQLQTRNFG